MKQATLKAAGTAALGVAIAAVAAGSASAAAPGGLGGPTSLLTNSGALTGAATSTVGKLPATAPVTEAVGNLNPDVAGPVAQAPESAQPMTAPVTEQTAPMVDAAAAPVADAAAPRALPVPLPGAEGLAQAPGVSTVTGALGGGLPGGSSLPGIGG
ncbi:hypothetical protein ACIA8O_27600 [Kitasatospora sp. NPDC051853]|uniref:hypothetical protein n=1 Tax=Kitasatospora sp. NPDC051853 TaxID=3364058 RepID=UPI00378EFAAA